MIVGVEDLDFTGLKKFEWDEIFSVFKKVQNLEKAILFGSRALGTFHAGSDVDLCLVGQSLSHENLLTISSLLNTESSLPYRFDLIDYKIIELANFKKHIDDHGIVIYKGVKNPLMKS